jgi:type IX secretion system PorP/SprF family membrane protein
MKSYIIFIYAVLVTSGLFSQQLPNFTAYRDHWNILNPAALSNNLINNELHTSIAASGRYQWWGMKDSPQTYVVNAEVAPQNENWVAGGYMMMDKVGFFNQFSLYGQYAYILRMGGRSEESLVFGMNVGVVQSRLAVDKLLSKAQEDLPVATNSTYYMDANFGMFYHYEDVFYAGLSVPQLLGGKTRFNSAVTNVQLRRLQHFYAVAGTYIGVSWFGQDDSFLEPSMWVRYVPNTPISMDTNVRYQLSETLYFGAGWGLGVGGKKIEFSGIAHAEFGMSFEVGDGRLKTGFGFDFPTNSYRSGFGQSGEITMVYSF